MASKPQVLICGAGPAGLVAALSLAKNGIPIRIIDQSNEYQEGTRGSGLQPRSQELFQLLGVLPEILKTAIQLPPFRQYGPDGKEVVGTWLFDAMEPVRPDVPFPNQLLNQQSVTCAVLRKALAQHGVEIELGVSIKTFTQSASDVTATLCKTSAEGVHTEEVLEVPYLIGADGAKGVTRKLLGVGFSGESFPQTIVVADAVVEGLDYEHWHSFGDPATAAIRALPIGGNGRYNLFINGLEADLEKIVAEGAEGLSRSIMTITRRPDIKVRSLVWMSIFNPSFRCAETFGVGRVFLSGDVAHVHSPMGGQGLTTSIQDSHNLAWKLALVLKGKAPGSLLNSYNEERIPLVKCMLGITQNLHVDAVIESNKSTNPTADTSSSSSVQPPSQTPGSGSGSGYSRVSGLKAGQQRSTLLKQLGVHYRWSPIVVDARIDDLPKSSIATMKLTAYGIEGADTSDVWAGDRAHDAPVTLLEGDDSVPTTFHELFSPAKHTAFVFIPSGTPEEHESLKAALEASKAFGEDLNGIFVIASSASDAPKHLGRDVRVLVDSKHHAQTGYGIDKIWTGSSPPLVTVIVRPDAVVGAFVFDAEGIERYRRKIFIA